MKKLFFMFLLLLASPALAADNTVIVTPGVGVTMRSRDVGSGVQSMQSILGDTSGNAFGLTGNPLFISYGTGVTLPAYAAIPTFKIDQTTPGTTNLVQIGGTLPAFAATPTVNLGTISTASTAAKQPALGVAGTPSADVITVQSPAADPCRTVANTYTPISITTATTTRIVAPTSAKKTYICNIILTSAAADNVGIVEGTGGTCGTGTAGVIGGTTAANGPNFAANGGLVFGGGGYFVAATAGTNVDLCLITSAATPLAGGIKWVQAP